MKHFFKTLMTIFSEPRILRETWDKEVHFPENYWRTELCVYFLWQDDKDDLPNALRYNFCPLFWFSNLVLLLIPLWLPVYLIIKGLNLFCEATVTPSLDSFHAWKTERRATIKLENTHLERERIKNTKFDPTKVNLNLLRRGKAFINCVLWSTGSVGADESDPVNARVVNWDNPRLLEECDEEEAYFMAFRRTYGADWPQQYARLEREAEESHRRDLEAKRAEERRVQQVQADLNKMFASIFSWSKIICKAILFLVALPVIYFVAIGCYKLAVWLFYFIGWLLWVMFVQNLTTTCIVIVSVVAILSFIALMVYLFSEKIIQSLVGSTFSKLEPIIEVILTPIVWVFLKIGAFGSFCFNFIRMFYVSNCPGIKYPGDK